MNELAEKLTASERRNFKQLEKVIEKHTGSVFRFGAALRTIRDERYYRQDYKTFEDYCQQRWGWSRTRGQQFIDAARVIELVPGAEEVITTERAARALSELPEDQRQEAVDRARKTGEPVGRKKKTLPVPPNLEQRLDRTGIPIPKAVLPLWDRCEEIQTHLSMLSQLRATIAAAQEEKDLAYAEVNFVSILSHLGQARVELKTVKPYAVCPTCQGLNPNLCRLCCGRGFISEFKWKGPCVPRETKEMRFKLKK